MNGLTLTFNRLKIGNLLCLGLVKTQDQFFVFTKNQCSIIPTLSRYYTIIHVGYMQSLGAHQAYRVYSLCVQILVLIQTLFFIDALKAPELCLVKSPNYSMINILCTLELPGCCKVCDSKLQTHPSCAEKGVDAAAHRVL